MKRILNKVSTKEVDAIEGLDMLEIDEIFKKGTKFRYVGDWDPWYIVGLLDDDDKVIVVYKSWSKYKQRWLYKSENVFSLMWSLALTEQLYKDLKGKYYIKYEKKKA